MLAFKRFVSSVHSSVNFQIFCPGEVLLAFGALEGFLSSVNSHVVDQLVLGLEALVVSGAPFPEAEKHGVVRVFHVIVVDVFDQVVQRLETLVAAHLTWRPSANVVLRFLKK